MQVRIFGVKKSLILTSLFVVLCAGFISTSLLTILLYKNYYLWFFIFCLSCGFYQLAKGVMFRFDSALYFGILLLSIGGVGFYTIFSGNGRFQSVFYILSFASASYFTYLAFNQKFQLFLAILIYFACIMWLLVKINIFSVEIFVAITVASVIIFILSYTALQMFNKKRDKV